MALMHVQCSDGTCAHDYVAPGASTHKTLVIGKSVGAGGANFFADTKVIQAALNLVSPLLGGPLTPLAVTGKCDAATIEAIRRYQTLRVATWSDPSLASKPFKVDGLIQPEHRTLLVLRIDWEAYQQGSAGPLISEGELVAAVVSAIGMARSAMQAAQRALSVARDAMRGISVLDRKAPGLVEAFFQFSKYPNETGADHLDNVDLVFDRMLLEANLSGPYGLEGLGAIRRNQIIKEDAPDAKGRTAIAYCFQGGRSHKHQTVATYNIPYDGIYFCAAARSKSPTYLAECLVHELAHFCAPYPGGGVIDDRAYKHAMIKLPYRERVHNADSYSAFAMCAKYGTSRAIRYEDGKLIPI